MSNFVILPRPTNDGHVALRDLKDGQDEQQSLAVDAMLGQAHGHMKYELCPEHPQAKRRPEAAMASGQTPAGLQTLLPG